MAVWRTRTSPAPGAASSTSSQRITSGPPLAWMRMALGMGPWLVGRTMRRLRARDKVRQGRRAATALTSRLSTDDHCGLVSTTLAVHVAPHHGARHVRDVGLSAAWRRLPDARPVGRSAHARDRRALPRSPWPAHRFRDVPEHRHAAALDEDAGRHARWRGL